MKSMIVYFIWVPERANMFEGVFALHLCLLE